MCIMYFEGVEKDPKATSTYTNYSLDSTNLLVLLPHLAYMWITRSIEVPLL